MEKYGNHLKTSFLCVFVLALMLSSTPGFGATIRVPEDYQLIQTAIDAASDGDTILVADGTYKGTGNYNIKFRGKAVTVRSVNGPQNCIIDCDGGETAFSFSNGEGSQQEVHGFTIINTWRYAIDIRRSSPIITNCVISGIKAGGILCASFSSPTITDCTISAGYDPGIRCYYSSPIITNCTISGSQESGIYSESSSPIITNCTISGNQESGIYSESSSPIITNCTISGNQKSGIHSGYSSPTISNCKIRDNKAYGNGGGILLLTGQNDYPTITNCIISRNEAKAHGGGIACYGDFTPTVTNCTISSNTSVVSGGGIYSDPTNLTITNSILWGNSPDDLAPFKSDYMVTYSDLQDGHKGEGNINANPQFVGGGDYHLTASSPCIDEGISEGAPDHDIDGDSRPQGAGYDMGADEYAGPAPCLAAFSASPTRGVAPLTVNFTDQSTGKVDSWNWDFGDGSTSNEQNPSHIYNDLGCYTVSLTVAGPGGSDKKTKTDYIKVGYPAKAMPWLMLLLDDDK